YSNGSNADSQHVNISINAKTSDVEHYMRFTPGMSSNGGNSTGTATLSREQAQQKAIDFMKNAMSSKVDQIAFDPASAQVMSYPQSNDYQFRFVPLLDGLPVNGFIMDLSVNGTTGAIESFNADPASRLLFKHPAKDKAMSVEAAKDYYVQHNELQLQYIPIYETGASIYDRITKIKGVVLAYAPFQLGIPQVLNAVTGDWNPLYGGGSQANITDIKGHWAEKQLQFFADQGIFDVQDGKLDPNATVTRGDVMKYLIVATSGARSSHNKAHFSDVPSTDPNYEHIEEAYARKWIDTAAKSFRPSDAMTREELADIVVRVLGYQKLASSPDAFKARFGDVNTTSPYFGDIAIVSSLGLMSGYDKTFTPHQKVTKAQLAVVLAKVMEQLQDKQGYPYF
ncbi:MAG: S-layer homology domain-containing protein, partial [Tumebacillaceae bacterium]